MIRHCWHQAQPALRHNYINDDFLSLCNYPFLVYNYVITHDVGSQHLGPKKILINLPFTLLSGLRCGFTLTDRFMRCRSEKKYEKTNNRRAVQ